MTIRELRQHYSLTQQQLADIIGCSLRNIENWESGRTECKPYLLRLIAHYLSTTQKENTTMTINHIIANYPEATEIEIYVYDDYKPHHRRHPEFVTFIEDDAKLRNYDFPSASAELIDKEEYLSRWDSSGILDPDDIEDGAQFLLIFLDRQEYESMVEAASRIKVEISNCWTLEVEAYDGRPLFAARKEYSNSVELEDGRWLTSLGDGRYHLDDNENILFAAVFENEYDEDGELNYGKLMGYCEV